MGRLNPKHSAQALGFHLPPFEARLAPLPPKRRKSQAGPSNEPDPTFDWEKELYDAINDEDVFQPEERRPISPLSPLKKDFGVQVRKRDFLTTSRDTQTASNVFFYLKKFEKSKYANIE